MEIDYLRRIPISSPRMDDYAMGKIIEQICNL